jgi:hypothetical protein
MFLSIMVIGLWPILTTVIVADDLIGPFAMYVNAGPDLLSNLRVGYEAASYGHFNYVGQVFGGFVNWFWLRLMAAGIRFSTIYALTKLGLFVLLALLSARVTRRLLAQASSFIPIWRMRVAIAVSMIGTLQLHMVWSNDPVASYPMSGYASVLLALVTIDSYITFFEHRTWVRAITASFLLLVSILYYEMNLAVVVAVVAMGMGWMIRTKSRGKDLWLVFLRIASTGAIPVAIVAFLQHQNSAKSVQYTGTAVSLGPETVSTFGRLLVSNLPLSSWHLGLDWVQNSIPVTVVKCLALVAVAGMSAFLITREQRSIIRWTSTMAPVAVFLTLGISATLVQASTSKVQGEATRIGSVYNFYAVGSTAVAVVIAVLVVAISMRRRVLFVCLPVLVVLGSFQFLLNSAIQQRHYYFLPQNRNILAAFSERWEKEDRCKAVEQWLAMGWPTYYSNSMIVGMERAFLNFHEDEFCGRF